MQEVGLDDLSNPMILGTSYVGLDPMIKFKHNQKNPVSIQVNCKTLINFKGTQAFKEKQQIPFFLTIEPFFILAF